MKHHEWLSLERDCEALLIPTAVPIHIPAGTLVQIMQTLGGNITVNINGNLARIAQQDCDALGINQEDLPKPMEKKAITGPVNMDLVWEQLRQCYDPEIPISIVELGLIYKCECFPTDNPKGNLIKIDMTLTAPGCGMGPVIMEDAKYKVLEVPNVSDVEIELVFDPPWDRDRISEAGKLELGLL
jgi:probable FeS assembly SUF system protein SufT